MLVSDCHCLQNIFEVLSVMHHSFEKAVLGLKPHGPNVQQGPKALDKSRIVLHIMMFRTEPNLRENL